jgi:hypothetical protein
MPLALENGYSRSPRAYERPLAERLGHAGIFDWDGNYNALAAAWLLLDERLTTSWQGLGAVLVIAAITLYVRYQTRPATLSEPRQSR